MKNEKFEQWLKDNHIEHFFYADGTHDFFYKPLVIQWGVYLEFFDSIEIVVYAVKESYLKDDGYSWEVGTMINDAPFSYSGYVFTLKEAQDEAIAKAFEFLDQQEATKNNRLKQ